MSTIIQLEQRIQQLETLLEKHRTCPIYNVLTRTGLEEVWQNSKKIPDLAIAFLDIDDLKIANNELGQYEANKRIADAFGYARSNEIIKIGRFFYGDEAVILAPASEIIKPCERIQSALIEREMSATFAIVSYAGEPDLAEATKRANQLVQDCKLIKKGVIYNFLESEND